MGLKIILMPLEIIIQINACTRLTQMGSKKKIGYHKVVSQWAKNSKEMRKKIPL